MSKLMKWKNSLFLTLALGVISLSAYGIYNTAQAYNDLPQTQTISLIVSSDATDAASLVPGGSSCNPLGCAACQGCVNSQYQQNIEALPSTTAQVETY